MMPNGSFRTGWPGRSSAGPDALPRPDRVVGRFVELGPLGAATLGGFRLTFRDPHRDDVAAGGRSRRSLFGAIARTASEVAALGHIKPLAPLLAHGGPPEGHGARTHRTVIVSGLVNRADDRV